MGFFVVSALAATAMPIVSEKRTAGIASSKEVVGQPAFGVLSADASNVCAGTEVTMVYSGGDDSGFDVSSIVYEWSVTLDGVELTINGDSLNFSLDPDWPQITSDISPTPLVFTLTITDGVVTEIETWDNLVTVYPGPEITPLETLVCADQGWQAVITGPDSLQSFGPSGSDTLVSTINSAGELDFTLPATHIEFSGGPTAPTAPLYGFLNHPEVGLVCSTESVIDLDVKKAPLLTLSGFDPPNAAGEFVLCEGADLTLTADADVNGADEDFNWIVESSYPYQSNGNVASFLDVEPVAPLTSATLVSGKAEVV